MTNGNTEENSRKSEIRKLTYDEAKDKGLLEMNPIKAQIMGMTFDEAKDSGMLGKVETEDEECHKNPLDDCYWHLIPAYGTDGLRTLAACRHDDSPAQRANRKPDGMGARKPAEVVHNNKRGEKPHGNTDDNIRRGSEGV